MSRATQATRHIPLLRLEARSVLGVTCLTLAAACTPDEPAQDTSTQSPSASTQAGPSASASATSPEASEFHIAGFALALDIADMGDRALVVSTEHSYWDRGNALYTATASGLVQDYALHKGSYQGYSSDRQTDLFGSFPHAAWVQHESDRGGCWCFGTEHIIMSYLWTDSGWKRTHKHDSREKIIAVSAPTPELSVALVGNAPRQRLFPANDSTTVQAELAAPSDVETTGLDGKPLKPASVSGCKTALRVNAFTGKRQRPLLVLSSGHIFVAGKSCWDAGKLLLVERFEPGAKQGKVDVVKPAREPVQAWKLQHPPVLAGIKHDVVYLLERRTFQLMRFDGSKWSEDELPVQTRMQDVYVGSDGTVWVAAQRGLFRKKDGKWSKVPLPGMGAAEPTPTAVVALPDGSVWVVAAAGNTDVLLTTAKVPIPVELPSLSQRASELCKQPYVVVDREFDPTTKEFPELAKRLAAVPGANELQFGTVIKERTVELGASVKSVAQGKHMLAALKGLPHVDPHLRCYIPEHDRTVDITISPTTPSLPPPAAVAPKLNGPVAKVEPPKLSAIGKPPEGTSPKPDGDSWLGRKQVKVQHAASLGCKARMQREWLRLDCAGVSDFKLVEPPKDKSSLVFASSVVVAALRPGMKAKLSCRTVDDEERVLSIAYPEDADAAEVAFDRAGLVTQRLYPPPGLGLATDEVKVPQGKGPKGEVGPLWFDRTEVTVEAYAECVLAGKCTAVQNLGCKNGWPHETATKPVNCVSYDQAEAYCSFRGKRLPTEAEWLYAALGSDGRPLPWGKARIPSLLCRDDSAEPRIAKEVHAIGDDTCTACSVGGYPAGQSPHGLLDAAGNVAEWTSTKEGDDHVVLGGHYQPYSRIESLAVFDFDKLEAQWRVVQPADQRRAQVGFRCVRDAK